MTLPELRRLADAVDWLDHYDWNTMDTALAASPRGVVAIANSTVVGTARLVGDGVAYCYVQDVLVDPAFSDRGIASTLVERLLAWVGSKAAQKCLSASSRARTPRACTSRSGSPHPAT